MQHVDALAQLALFARAAVTAEAVNKLYTICIPVARAFIRKKVFFYRLPALDRLAACVHTEKGRAAFPVRDIQAHTL